jgi:hypothetical protein
MLRFIKIGIVGASLILATDQFASAQQSGTQKNTQGAGTQQTQPGVGNSQTPATATSGVGTGAITQNPWHSGLQQQLNLTPQQTQQLNQTYMDHYNKYQQQISSLPNTLNAQERQQRMNQYRQDFYNNYNTSTASMFTSPDQRSRYNQLYLQYRGYGAFEDPSVQQKLNLTDAQKQQIMQFEQNWNTQMDAIRAQYKTDPNGARLAFDRLQQQNQQNINSTLTPGQMAQWRQIIGNPYSFQATHYMPVGSAAPNGGNNK